MDINFTKGKIESPLTDIAPLDTFKSISNKFKNEVDGFMYSTTT
jgi:hypothetical protein